jgi:Icc-related predicted phosphoesterase
MRHRLLCCSDTQGKLPPPLDETGAIAWLHGGDVCNGPDVVDIETNTREDLLRSPGARWFSDRKLPIHLVSGNHDTVDVYHAFTIFGDLSGRIVPIAENLFVAGIGWHGEKHFELPYERDLEPICQSVVRQAAQLIFGRDRVILLTHFPPRFRGLYDVPNDVDGAGIWFECVRSVVDLLEPIAVVQGHKHTWWGATHRVQLATRQCLILNPGPTGCVLEIDDDTGNCTCLST